MCCSWTNNESHDFFFPKQTWLSIRPCQIWVRHFGYKETCSISVLNVWILCVCVCVCVCVLGLKRSISVSACMLSCFRFSHSQLCDPKDCSPPTPLSIEFSRQEYWSGLPYPPPGDLPDPRTESVSFTSPALVGRFFNTSATWESGIYK